MRKIRMGMVGGGAGAFIGEVHRRAAFLDGQIDLVCGAFSSDPAKSKSSGVALFVDEDRCYANYTEMMEREAALPEDVRMDFVCIVTPNHVHYGPAKAALEHGFHVMSDKPATYNVAEAEELAALAKKTGLYYGLTHAYTGYPMVKQARKMVADGSIGKVRKVVVEYPQGWLATKLEDTGLKQAWRTDPKTAGISCCMGDIGSHCENLAEYITGLSITELCADLTAFVEGRTLDDDGNVLIRMENGAKGVLHSSQISVGEENSLNIRIYGETGGLEWHQQEPNTLIVKHLDKPTELYRTGLGYLDPIAAYNTRMPAGHPEGLIEAFANLYRNLADCIRARIAGTEPSAEALDFPTIDDGVRGMAFIEACVDSSNKGASWVSLGEPAKV